MHAEVYNNCVRIIIVCLLILKLRNFLQEENKTIKVDTPHKRSSPVINKYEAEISDLKEQNEILKRYQVNAENVIESLKMKIEEFGEHEKMFTSLTSALKASEEETVQLRADFENLYKSKEAYVQMVNDRSFVVVE